MNKNLAAIVGLFLVAVIAYQAYLLGKKEALNAPAAVKEPKITVTIDDEALEKEAKTQKSAQNKIQTDNEPVIDERKIKEDINKLFKDIFDNPKVKEQINENLSQFQKQLKEGVSEFQKEMFNIAKGFEEITKNDNFLKDFFKNIKFPKTLEFSDLKDHYYLKTPPIADENSTVDIKVKGDFMLISVNENIIKESNRNTHVVKKEIRRKEQLLVSLPKDAKIDEIKTNYKDFAIEITIPKKEIK